MVAKTLAEALRGKLTGPEAGGVQDETARTQNLLRAKLGKAAGQDTAPRQSNMQEQQSAFQTRLGLKNQQNENTLAAEQLSQESNQIEQQAEEQLKNLDSRREDIKQDFELKTENLLEGLERGNKQLDAAETKARLEQAGFLIRLQNDQYVTNLKQAGERARLDDQISFKINLAKQEFSNLRGLLDQQLDYRRIADANAREFTEELAGMDINYAMDIAKQAAEAANRAAMYQGAGQVATGAAKAYDKGLFSSDSKNKE